MAAHVVESDPSVVIDSSVRLFQECLAKLNNVSARHNTHLHNLSFIPVCYVCSCVCANECCASPDEENLDGGVDRSQERLVLRSSRTGSH